MTRNRFYTTVDIFSECVSLLHCESEVEKLKCEENTI